jgi:hypothetical protein
VQLERNIRQGTRNQTAQLCHTPYTAQFPASQSLQGQLRTPHSTGFPKFRKETWAYELNIPDTPPTQHTLRTYVHEPYSQYRKIHDDQPSCVPPPQDGEMPERSSSSSCSSGGSTGCFAAFGNAATLRFLEIFFCNAFKSAEINAVGAPRRVFF